MIPRRKGNNQLVATAPPNLKLPAWAEHKPAAPEITHVPESQPDSESDPEDLVFD